MTEPVELPVTHPCPRCGFEAAADNKFCEECGSPLIVATPPAATTPDPDGCAKCGAPASQIGEDGFCSSCGFRREEPARNHMEMVLAPWFAAVSDRGMRHRRNEDYVAIQWINERQCCVAVVCDGVSSTREPERASEAAANEALRILVESAQREDEFTHQEMQAAITGAQQAVANVSFTKVTGQDSPATTIVAAIAWPKRIVIGWMGDSRAYWLGESSALQLTADHSWMWEILATGKVTEEEAANSPNAHAITKWLGADTDGADASIVEIPVEAAGRLLLCTDGLWNYAHSAQDIAGLLAGEPGDVSGSAMEAAQKLVNFANESGGHDNISAAVLSFGAQEWSKQVDD